VTEVLELPRWQAVGLVIDRNTRDFLSGRFGLAHDLVAWFKAIALFRSAEDERMWHANTLSAARRREVLKAVFDVEEPRT